MHANGRTCVFGLFFGNEAENVKEGRFSEKLFLGCFPEIRSRTEKNQQASQEEQRPPTRAKSHLQPTAVAVV